MGNMLCPEDAGSNLLNSKPECTTRTKFNLVLSYACCTSIDHTVSVSGGHSVLVVRQEKHELVQRRWQWEFEMNQLLTRWSTAEDVTICYHCARIGYIATVCSPVNAIFAEILIYSGSLGISECTHYERH